jgi:PST family polysaccharide transporter
MSSLRERTFEGVSWSVVGKIGKQALNFGVEIFLIRLLSPREFGLVAMVVIFTGFARVLRDVGLGAAIVQYQDLTEKHRSSVFWVDFGAGLLLTGLFAGSSSLIAGFYAEPILIPLTIVLASQFFIGALSAVHRKLFQKTIDFRSLSLAEIGSTLLAGGTAITMALGGYGVWSLVAKYLINTVAATVVLWTLSSWRPHFLFSWEALRDLWRFSLNLLGQKSLNFWLRRLDDLLIGRYLGSDPLGLYTRAYKIMLVPLKSVSRVIGRVMFPALSSIQDDIPRVRRTYLRMTGAIALITFPLTLGLLATVEPFVIGILGEQWSGMIPILSVFCITSLWQSISTLNGNLYLSQGRTDIQFRVSMVMNPFIISGIVVGLQWGTIGVAVGYTVTSLINGYVNFRYAGGIVGITYAKLLYHLSGIFACAASMSGAVYGLGHALPPEWPHWLRLLTQVPSGIIFYWALIHMFGVRAYQETCNLLIEQFSRRLRSIIGDS